MTTASALRDQIARKVRQRNEWNILGLSDWDQDAQIAAEIADLREELAALTETEATDQKEAA